MSAWARVGLVSPIAIKPLKCRGKFRIRHNLPLAFFCLVVWIFLGRGCKLSETTMGRTNGKHDEGHGSQAHRLRAVGMHFRLNEYGL